MRLPWRRKKPDAENAENTENVEPGALVITSTTMQESKPEREGRRIVSFGGDLEDAGTLKHHAVRALCALLMDRHDLCNSEHQFCGPHTHRKNGDSPFRLIAHPIPQAMDSGEDLLGIYLCQASNGMVDDSTSGDSINPLEFTARLVCAGRVPHRKAVAQLCDDGSYYISIGPMLDTVLDDHSSGQLDQAKARRANSHPEPAFTRWEYYEPQLAKGPLRVVPEFHCLQVFGDWWVVDLDREAGAYQQIAALAVGNNPDHEQ